MYITISTVSKADLDTCIHVLGKGDHKLFFTILLQFGEAVVQELTSGSVFTSGTNFLGYTEAGIDLTSAMKTITNVGWSKEVILPDVPDMQRLRVLMRQTGQRDPNKLLERFAYWLCIASQVRWMEYSLFVMNARAKRWESFHFKPLDDVRHMFAY
jgi:hypothetical protein